MARIVEEVMNPELASARPGEESGALLELILALGITAVPVLDSERRPVGVISLRDLVDPTKAAARMTSPAVTVLRTATLDEAARVFCGCDYHHLVVVDEHGVAVGMVSIADVLRGLRGVATRHPAAFPHRDKTLGVSWSDEGELEPGRVASVPTYPGVIVLVFGAAGVRETPVWAEQVPNLRARLDELLSVPQEPARLAGLLARGHLRFRAAYVADAARRKVLVDRITGGLEHLPPPQAGALD